MSLGITRPGISTGGLNLLKLPGWIVPFLGAAYSRSRELTCDRVGAYLAQDSMRRERRCRCSPAAARV